MRDRDTKRVALNAWKEYQGRLPTDEELNQWFAGRAGAMCLVCGAVSGNLEMIDFDLGGEAFAPWREAVNAAAPGLVERLVIESTPSGGRHVVYRCEAPVCGSTKLASKRIEADGPGELVVGAKSLKAHKDADGNWHVVVTKIETRGEGGIFLCAPSDGYAIVQGDLLKPPVITADERDLLLGCAWALDELARHVLGGPPRAASEAAAPAGDAQRPGDEFNARGDVREILRKHGWRLVRAGENEHWCRPGKDHGTSATLKGGIFYVFSSNAPPFEPQRGYAPFAVYALLEHAGDWSAAAATLRAQGYGAREQTHGVDLSGLVHPPAPLPDDPLQPAFVWAADLHAQYPALRPPVINKLLREGETMNVIAAPKTGKSWLTLDLALAVASGCPWLGRYETTPGDVLIIDNELHRETSASRIPQVARARGLDFARVGRHVAIDNLRGRLRDIFALGAYFARLEPGRFRLIVLDAFYRFMPLGGDENDNGTMANIYNAIDAYADRLGCAFVLIHHSTKGNQSAKSVTDVGAGAGSQSRASDTHLVLRPHEEEGCVVLDAAVRSWAPIEPTGLRWSFPVWDVDETLDPSLLRSEKPGKRKADRSEDREAEPEWDAARFVQSFLSDQPLTKVEIREAARQKGLSWRRIDDLIDLAEAQGLIHRAKVGRSHKVVYSTSPLPSGEVES
ncbi:MAG: AAA family ATPase [Phycisphaeraceae bacterium]|nr:AAA family ATPase [Phycisphaeraceae bacterium]